MKFLAIVITCLSLTACNYDFVDSGGGGEASPIRYSIVSGYAERDHGNATIIAQRALSDGVLTNSEYDDVIEAVDAIRELGYEADKEMAIRRWANRED